MQICNKFSRRPRFLLPRISQISRIFSAANTKIYFPQISRISFPQISQIYAEWEFGFPDFPRSAIAVLKKWPQIQSMKTALRENEISYAIRRAIFTVYNKLGPGLLESVYEAALCLELTRSGLKVSRQVGIPVIYDGENLDL